MNLTPRVKEIVEYAHNNTDLETLLEYNISGETLKRYERIYKASKTKTIDQEIQENKNAKDLRIIKQKYKHALDKIEHLEKTNDFIKELSNTPSTPFQIKANKVKNDSESTAIMLSSDVHAEQLITKESTNGLNEYNLEICKDRMEKFFKGSQRLIDIQRNGVKIDNIILAILGDVIEGYIHEECMQNNQISPTEAIMFMFDIYVAGINYLLNDKRNKHITVVCCTGNHGRTSKRTNIYTRTQTSYEWLLYQFLANEFKKNKRVKFIIPESYFAYVELYDFMLRFHHGDAVRYGGGVGGVTIPLNKAIAKWNKSIFAHYDFCAHFHEALMANNVIINGSVPGFNALTNMFKFSYNDPEQMLIFINNKYGLNIPCKINLK